MRDRFSGSIVIAAVAAVAIGGARIALFLTQTSAQAPVLKTSWGEPDLQGIWTVETDTPLQRSPKYANQEFYTQTQREQLDRERMALLRRDRRVERGTELDVAGAYNALFMTI